ncbi:MAG: hypothetical protein K2J85_07985 [Anaeroplasmataceae bacterium]|nr:hypothetical protein [Anaeroplasmataceae bacterium]
MKKIILGSLLAAFVLFFIGIGLILYASLQKYQALMIIGLSCLILGAMGYVVIGFILFFSWYKKKFEVK